MNLGALCRLRPKISAHGLILCLLFGAIVPLQVAGAQTSGSVRTVLSAESTVTGELIRYPAGAAAKITAVEITLEPGQQTGWHTHPVPLIGYILEGELTVDYGPKGERVYVKGDALAESMSDAHNGRNTGAGIVKILAMFIGMEGVPDSAPAAVPGRR
jgi:quercetin dioxygenase-like cupin family protein